MTDPTTLPTSEGTENSAAETTKKLFSPVTPEKSIDTNNTTSAIKTSEKEKENKEDRLKTEDTLAEHAKTETKASVPTTEALFAETQKTNIANPLPKDLVSGGNAPTTVQTPTTVIKSETPASTNTNEAIISEKVETSLEAKTATDLQKDMQIIANIQKTEPEKTKIENKATTETPMAENVFNLDSLSVDIPIPKMIGTGGTEKAKIPENPYDNLQKIIPQIMPSINKIGGSQNKNIGIGVIVILLLLGWFVIKTMYPIQYEETINGIVGGNDEESISTEIEQTPITGEILGTGNELMPEIESGNILLDSGNSLVDSGMLEVLTGSEGNIEANHNAAGSETQGILEQNNTESVDNFKTKLETFVNQGKISLEEGKKTNNKDIIKYSTALYKKAESYLQNLANGQEITTDEMTTILAELGSYLVKISPTTDANVSIGAETGETSIQTGKTEISNETSGNSVPQTETSGITKQENNTTTSGGGNFDPDAFFGN